MTKKHKVDWGPGFRLFICDCEHIWDEKSRHCQSLSVSSCPECDEIVSPIGYDEHYEWETDPSGNLI